MVPWLTRSTLDHASIQKMSGVARCQQPAARKKKVARRFTPNLLPAMALAGGAGHRKGAVATGSAYQKLAKKPGTNLKLAINKSEIVDPQGEFAKGMFINCGGNSAWAKCEAAFDGGQFNCTNSEYVRCGSS